MRIDITVFLYIARLQLAKYRNTAVALHDEALAVAAMP